VYYVLKRKLQKFDFCLKTTPFGVKMCRGSEFDIYKNLSDSRKAVIRYTTFLESEEFYQCQIRIPRTFLPQKESFLGKNRIFATFRFNTQYAFSESGNRGPLNLGSAVVGSTANFTQSHDSFVPFGVYTGAVEREYNVYAYLSREIIEFFSDVNCV
jgi:hypothetical protein